MNMQAIMAQAQRMQKDMEKKKEEINNTDYVGSSQLVEVVVSGSKKVKSVKLKNMDSFEIDDIEILEDMIKIAINDAMEKIEKDVESKMGVYAKQLGGLI